MCSTLFHFYCSQTTKSKHEFVLCFLKKEIILEFWWNVNVLIQISLLFLCPNHLNKKSILFILFLYTLSNFIVLVLGDENNVIENNWIISKFFVLNVFEVRLINLIMIYYNKIQTVRLTMHEIPLALNRRQIMLSFHK